MAFSHPDVERIVDVPYADVSAATSSTSTAAPTAPTGCPTLLQVHGGGWVIGDKQRAGPAADAAPGAQQGWVCFAPNYRLSPRATWPDHLIDVKRAIAWVREHGAEYGADPGFLVLTGGSAGGQLARCARSRRTTRRTSRGSRTPTRPCRAASPTTASTTWPRRPAPRGPVCASAPARPRWCSRPSDHGGVRAGVTDRAGARRAPRRSSSSTGATTPSSPCRRRGCSSSGCGRSRERAGALPRAAGHRSTPSTCSRRSGPTTSSGRSAGSASCCGSGRGQVGLSGRALGR